MFDFVEAIGQILTPISKRSSASPTMPWIPSIDGIIQLTDNQADDLSRLYGTNLISVRISPEYTARTGNIDRFVTPLFETGAICLLGKVWHPWCEQWIVLALMPPEISGAKTLYDR